MERSTHTIKLPVSGAEVVIRDWLTGGEKRKLIAANKDDHLETLGEILVVSIAGNTENIRKQMDSLHGKDFDTIFLELAKVIGDSSVTEEKKSV